MKKYFKKAWQAWLFLSIPLSVLIIILSVCALDSESNIPIIALSISAAWMLLLTVANDPYRK